MNSLNRLINFKLALKKTVIIQLFIFILVRKKEENLKGVIQERTLRLKERNDELISHVQSFKMERSRMYDQRAEKISFDLVKTEEKIVTL
jgi:hypothetical protein